MGSFARPGCGGTWTIALRLRPPLWSANVNERGRVPWPVQAEAAAFAAGGFVAGFAEEPPQPGAAAAASNAAPSASPP
jgi:hypothetical protein